MKVYNLCLGVVMTNVYFLLNEETKDLLIADPADNAEAIYGMVDKLEGTPRAVLLTHGHFDHILAAGDVAEKYGIPIVAYETEKPLLEEPDLNLSTRPGRAPYKVSPNILVKDGDEPEFPGFKFRVIHTPGHTAGSCCYYFYEDKVLISGDTLFYASCGRTDFPTSSSADMRNSLRRLVTELPEDTAVYPGHDCATSIGFEKKVNPFV